MRKNIKYIVLGFVALALLGWATYKITNSRTVPAAMKADTSCQTDPNTIADMSQFGPNAAPISCQAWDIGTGVTGYVWKSPNPKAVLLLQHGYGDYAQRYVKQNSQLIPHLLNMGISVYAFDMWGTNHSAGAPGATDVAQTIEDHRAASQKLRAQPLLIFFMGHSLGGLVTANSLVSNQTGIRGMVLLSSAIKNDVSSGERTVTQLGAFLLPTLPGPLPAIPLTDFTRDPNAIQRMTNDPLRYAGAPTWITIGSGVKIAEQNWHLYPQVNVPVLAIHGTADVVAKPNGSQEFIAAIASTDKTLKFIDGGLHFLLEDTGKDETLKMILTWLKNHLPAN